MKTIWKERFELEPLAKSEPSQEEFNSAWNWMFERGDEGLKRAGACLLVVHQHSLELRKRGIKNSAKMAAVGIWKRYREPVTLPTRKTKT